MKPQTGRKGDCRGDSEGQQGCRGPKHVEAEAQAKPETGAQAPAKPEAASKPERSRKPQPNRRRGNRPCQNSYQSPIVAMVIAILMSSSASSPRRAPRRPVPQHRPSGDPGKRYLYRGRCPHGRAVGGHPIEQQMSGVDNLDYMYSSTPTTGYDPLQLLRPEDRRQYRPDPLPDAGRPGRVSASEGCGRLRGDRGEIHLFALIMFALYSPKGTYDNVFLANYSYITSTTDDADQGHRSVTVFGAGQYAMRLWSSRTSWPSSTSPSPRS